MPLSRYYNESRVALRTYPGFKLFVATAYFVSLVLVTVPEALFHRVNAESLEFVEGYWLANRLRWCELAGLVILFCAVFLTDGLRPLHQKQFGRYRQEAVPFGWVAAGKILGCLSLIFAVYVIPFLNLHIPTLVLNVGKVAWAVSAVIPYFSFFKGEEIGSSIPSLAHSAFDKLYFDVAALAPLRSPIIERVNECLERCEKGPSDPETQNFIRNGQRGTPWGGLDDFFSRLGNFFGVGPEFITIHERTTSSLAFALDEIVRNRGEQRLEAARVLTTDIEYPGVIGELLPEFERQGTIQILPTIPLKHLICSGSSRERIQDAISSVSRDANADVILISHVYYATGYVLDIDSVFRGVEGGKKPIVVVDGAQSVGNIEVASKTFQSVDYYAAGAHKWLMVPRHMGILIRNRELLRNNHKFAHFESVSRPDSSFPVQSSPFSVTISYEPYFGLSAILRDEFQVIRMNNIASHNRRLAEVFRNEILALGYRPIGDDNQSSILSVSFGTVTEALQRSLQSIGIKCKFLKIESEGETIQAIRFCFHFYHSKDDVFRLLDSIESEIIRVRS
jgi:selenocysteine lyase/cysteine desulfurase